MSILRNPISYCIYVFIAVLMLYGVVGREPLVVLQHLVIPYTVDIARGVGEGGASVFRVVTFLLQLLIVSFVLLVVKARTVGQRTIVSIFGILFVIMYFLIVVFGYIMPRFH